MGDRRHVAATVLALSRRRQANADKLHASPEWTEHEAVDARRLAIDMLLEPGGRVRHLGRLRIGQWRRCRHGRRQHLVYGKRQRLLRELRSQRGDGDSGTGDACLDVHRTARNRTPRTAQAPAAVKRSSKHRENARPLYTFVLGPRVLFIARLSP